MLRDAAQCLYPGKAIRGSADTQRRLRPASPPLQDTDMELMIGAGLALALLYFWLIGHWFARVVMFLLLAVVGFIAGAALASASPNPPTFALVLFGLIGAALAWPLSGIPIYYWRHQFRLMGGSLAPTALERLWLS